MNIIFLCGCLEPGRDGVGDYTRRLAAELVVQGHRVMAIALNDHHAADESYQEQTAENVVIDVVRLRACSPLEHRFSRLGQVIKEFHTHWISLQYVPFSFDSQGLPFRLGYCLALLAKEQNWHIMFHELWVGSDTFNIKTTCLAYLQKMIIRKMLHRIRPGVMHSQLPINQQKLQKLGYPVKYLPLFSNVPVSSPQVPNHPHEIFRIGFFSQVESYECIIAFLDRFEKRLAENGHRVEILLMSGKETNTRSFINTMEKTGRFRNAITCTGFLKAEALSNEIRSCQLGVTPVPRHALGKSGSVAAFLAHGIPVAAPNVQQGYDSLDVGFFSPVLRSSILLTADLAQLPYARECAKSAKSQLDISTIAAMFISDLQGT